MSGISRKPVSGQAQARINARRLCNLDLLLRRDFHTYVVNKCSNQKSDSCVLSDEEKSKIAESAVKKIAGKVRFLNKSEQRRASLEKNLLAWAERGSVKAVWAEDGSRRANVALAKEKKPLVSLNPPVGAIDMTPPAQAAQAALKEALKSKPGWRVIAKGQFQTINSKKYFIPEQRYYLTSEVKTEAAPGKNRNGLKETLNFVTKTALPALNETGVNAKSPVEFLETNEGIFEAISKQKVAVNIGGLINHFEQMTASR